jgi:DNA repair protein RadC
LASGENNGFIAIKDWSEEDRPREKLLSKGREVLTDAELIAILLGTGFRETTAVDVAKTLLKEAGNDLEKLAKLSVKQLSNIKGIGPAKAITIIAALELGRRRKFSDKQDLKRVTGSKDAYDYLFTYLADQPHEEFYVLLLNRANAITRHVKVSQGGIAGTVVDNKIIFKPALEELSSGIILCHNHPSGNKNPSQEDISQTKKICEAGNSLDIKVLDHIIFTNEGYYSFADEGLI